MWKYFALAVVLLGMSAFGTFAAGAVFESASVGLVAFVVWVGAMLMSTTMPGAGPLIMLEGRRLPCRVDESGSARGPVV